jgi:hypothetical protein
MPITRFALTVDYDNGSKKTLISANVISNMAILVSLGAFYVRGSYPSWANGTGWDGTVTKDDYSISVLQRYGSSTVVEVGLFIVHGQFSSWPDCRRSYATHIEIGFTA